MHFKNPYKGIMVSPVSFFLSVGLLAGLNQIYRTESH